jgi:hypothetical protein
MGQVKKPLVVNVLLRDSARIIEILKQPKELRLAALICHAAHFQSDAAYWRMVGALWIEGGRTDALPVWRVLFSSTRRKRDRLMKKSGRRMWQKLPRYVTAFRAIVPGEDVERAISWTMNPDVLKAIYCDRREVVQRIFPRERIIAVFNERQEQEIIVL